MGARTPLCAFEIIPNDISMRRTGFNSKRINDISIGNIALVSIQLLHHSGKNLTVKNGPQGAVAQGLALHLR